MAGRKEQCVHHWILDNRDVGRCRYCGAVRDFGTMQGICRKELAERHTETARRTAGHSKKRGRKAKP